MLLHIYLTNVTHNNIRHGDLFHFSLPYNRELVFSLYPTLKTPKLPLLGIVIKRCH